MILHNSIHSGKGSACDSIIAVAAHARGMHIQQSHTVHACELQMLTWFGAGTEGFATPKKGMMQAAVAEGCAFFPVFFSDFS